MTNQIKILLVLFAFLGAFQIQAQNEQFVKANKYYDLFAFNLAIENYLAHLKLEPGNTLAIARIADCYRHTGNLDKAADWYQKAVLLPDRDPEVLFNYGLVLKSMAKYDEARNWFNNYSKTDKANQEKGIHYAKSCEYAKENVDADPPYKVVNAGINTMFSDFGPAYYLDKVVYSSFRQDKVANEIRDDINKESYNNLYVADISSKGGLQNARLLRDDYKAESNQCYVSYTEDGSKVAFVKNNNNFTNGVLPLTGSGVKMDIFLADVQSESSWTEAVSFPYNGARYSTGWPHMSPDGKRLFFASDAPGGYGGYDIYVSEKSGNTWSEPKNLGSRVNTPGNEISPYASGQFMFFASDWHPGFGGLDIFRSEKLDGVWSRVANLGYGVNTARNDYDYIFDESSYTGLFTSDRARGNGNDDLYQVIWVKPVAPMAAAAPEVVETLTFYKGIVQNSESKEGISDVTIKATNKNNQTEIRTSTDKKGVYELPLDVNASYSIVFSKAGFLNTAATVDVKPGSSPDFLSIQPMEPSPISRMDHEEIVSADFSSMDRLEKDMKPKGIEKPDSKPILVSPTEPETKKAEPVVADKPAEDGSVKAKKEVAESVLSKDVSSSSNRSVYEVQVGAYTKPNLAKLVNLRDLGTVYNEERGEVSIFKVGLFSTKEEAEKAKTEILRRGFEGAFVREIADPNVAMNAIVNKKSNSGKDSSVTPVKEKPATKDLTYSGNSKNETLSEKGIESDGAKIVFKVQLGAFKNTANITFDERLGNWGKIEHEDSGNGMIRILLGDFTSKKAADIAKEKAVSYGVKGAYVVAYKNGIKIPISQAVIQ